MLIQKAMHDTGMPPTRAEIARTLKFRSANAAEDHLRALERKGVLELLPGTSRGHSTQGFIAGATRVASGRTRCGRSTDLGAKSTSRPVIKLIPICSRSRRISCCAFRA